MKIKEIKAKTILDSNGERTIEISVNNCRTSAPSGKSRGKHERPAFKTTPAKEAKFIQNLKLEVLPEVNCFEDLEKIEKLVARKIGANTLYAFEASILKAFGKENGKELWQILNPLAKKIPKLLSNIIGGGVHSQGKPKPDFQEFLVIGNKKKNVRAYLEAKKLLKANKRDLENAWRTHFTNEQVLEIMKFANLRTGLDAAASQFYKKNKYYYKNAPDVMTRKEQIEYIIELIKNYKIYYMEDPLDEEDFKGFAEILSKTRKNAIISGDDLTATNLKRVKRAIEMKSINSIIVKPNQTGSLVEMKKIIDLCKSKGIKIIMSHRSGETIDDTIADLAVGFGCDMIKIPVFGKERLSKVFRLEEIKREIGRK